MRHNLSDVAALMKDRRSFSPEAMGTRKVHRDIRRGDSEGWHVGGHTWHDPALAVHGFQGRDGCVERGLPQWYASHVGRDKVNEARVAKLKARFDACNCVIGLGRVHDPGDGFQRKTTRGRWLPLCRTCI